MVELKFIKRPSFIDVQDTALLAYVKDMFNRGIPKNIVEIDGCQCTLYEGQVEEMASHTEVTYRLDIPHTDGRPDYALFKVIFSKN